LDGGWGAAQVSGETMLSGKVAQAVDSRLYNDAFRQQRGNSANFIVPEIQSFCASRRVQISSSDALALEGAAS
jgi:hypothetical protein